MKVNVTGKQIDVGDFLRQHVETSANAIVEKFFDKAIEAHVVFCREAHLVRADLSVHAGRGMMLQSSGAAVDAYAAFDAAGERLAQRLRRYKGRLRKHHGRTKDTAALPEPATAYVLAADSTVEEHDHEPAVDNAPLVIAEMPTTVPTASVSEAVMLLDLSDAPALLFRNSAHGTLNLIYRRGDGNIGWVDPALATPGKA
jgi:ribosomal subunit interface protein